MGPVTDNYIYKSSDACIGINGSASIQVMAWCLLSPRPLPKLMIIFFPIGFKGTDVNLISIQILKIYFKEIFVEKDRCKIADIFSRH